MDITTRDLYVDLSDDDLRARAALRQQQIAEATNDDQRNMSLADLEAIKRELHRRAEERARGGA